MIADEFQQRASNSFGSSLDMPPSDLAREMTVPSGAIIHARTFEAPQSNATQLSCGMGVSVLKCDRQR